MKDAVKKVNLLEPVDVDKISIRKDYYFNNAYMIDLPVDSAPDHVWQDIFEKEWKSSRHLWDRKLFVVGDKIRLITPASDFEEKLEWVKQVIAKTNLSIEEYNKETEAREFQVEEQMKKQTVEEEARIEKIKDTLRKQFRTF